MKNVTDWIRGFVFKYIGALVMEEKDGKMSMSLGRVCFVAVLVQLFIIWRKVLGGAEVDLPPGLMEMVYILAGYVFGSKAVQAVRLKWTNGKLSELEGTPNKDE